jgi:carboxymethylenebutenolidase
MCDDFIHPGLIEDWRLSRRVFVSTGMVVAGAAASAAHAEASVVEKEVSITTPNGTADAALFHPAGKGSWPAVLIWPDIMGLRPVFRDMARRLASDGYVLLVPNPFYRSKRAPVVEGNFNFNDPEARKTLFAYRQAISDEGMDGDARAYLSFLDSTPEVDRRKAAGVQGYCMGGPFAFRTAAVMPDRVGAVATFHGGGLVTDAQDSPHLLIPRTHAAYLVAIAQNDDARDPKAKDVLKAAFEAAKRPATVEVYPADHGWCVPGSQVYDRLSAERAWGELRTLYKSHLVAP